MILDNKSSNCLSPEPDKTPMQKLQDNIKDILDNIPNREKAVNVVLNDMNIDESVFFKDKALLERTLNTCIQFAYGTYILFDPQTKAPAVILQPEFFMVGDYIRKNISNSTNVIDLLVNFFSEKDAKSYTKMARSGGAFAGKFLGEYMIGKGKDLKGIADHMGSRAGRREAARIAEKNTEKMLADKLWKKATKDKIIDQAKKKAVENLAKSASRNGLKSSVLRNVGRVAANIGSILSLRVSSVAIEVLWPRDLADGTVEGQRKALVISAISKYCRENSNIDYYVALYYKIYGEHLRAN